MFEELWIIKDGLCLYHKSWIVNPLAVDGNLFSAFLTAFKSFQEEVFPSQAMRHIDFFSDRLVFLSTQYFYIVVRDQLEKPTERSVMQLSNISSELVELIENDSDLYPYFSKDQAKAMSLTEIEKKITPLLESVISMLSMAETQVLQFDVMTILQILREMKELILEIGDERIFLNFSRNETNQWFYEILFSEKDMNIESVPNINYKILNEIASDFIKQVGDSLALYGRTNDDLHYINLHNKIITFLSMNSEALKRFGVIDKLLSGPLRYFKF